MSGYEDPEKKETDGGSLAGTVTGPLYSDPEAGGKGEKAGEGLIIIDGEGESTCCHRV